MRGIYLLLLWFLGPNCTVLRKVGRDWGAVVGGREGAEARSKVTLGSGYVWRDGLGLLRFRFASQSATQLSRQPANTNAKKKTTILK